MSAEKINEYFRDLHALIKKENLGPEAIWNMDETGLQFQHKPTKVVAQKGQKRLYARCSDSKETVTVLACVNASGNAMPPMVIAKGKTKASVMSFETYLGPPDAIWTYQEKGWMENILGLEWFTSVFLPNCGEKRPQLLLLDSHSSHEVLELLERARNENIFIFALPPHTTQHLQPLDTTVFKPFKSGYGKACTEFMHDNPSRVIDKKSFPLMLNKAWQVMKNRELIQQAFRATGIYPPNINAISREVFHLHQHRQNQLQQTLMWLSLSPRHQLHNIP